MDLTKTYIEMCRQAKLLWKPAVGDFVLAIHGYAEVDFRKATDNGVLGIITKLSDCTPSFAIEPLSEGATAWYSIKDSIPLWRQDQLQAMITDKGYFRFSLIELFYHFVNDVFTNPMPVFCSPCTMERLWLAFVMKMNYKKRWNGSGWVAEIPKRHQRSQRNCLLRDTTA